jgi:hypothetical protein
MRCFHLRGPWRRDEGALAALLRDAARVLVEIVELTIARTSLR